MTQRATADAPRRGRGRPKGSKNRLKVSAIGVQPQPVANSEHAGSAPAPAAEEGELLSVFRDTARQLQTALSTETDPKLLASLASTLNRTIWHIGKLTGEGDITEAQIVRSKAWRLFLARLDPILAQHPEFSLEFSKFLDSLV